MNVNTSKQIEQKKMKFVRVWENFLHILITKEPSTCGGYIQLNKRFTFAFINYKKSGMKRDYIKLLLYPLSRTINVLLQSDYKYL